MKFDIDVAGFPGPQGDRGDPGVVTSNAFWTTLEGQTPAGVADGNPTTGTGTINNAAFDAALAVAQATGAKLWLAPGTYRLHNYTSTLPNDGVPNVNGVASQKPITIVGCGHHEAGEGADPTGSSIIMFTGSGTTPRWMTEGQGCLTMSDFSIINRESGAGRPFFMTTGTTIKADRLCFWSPKDTVACNDDIFVMGGNTVDPPWSGPDGAFQGYGFHMNDCYIDGCRSVKVNSFGNAVVITNNVFWNKCGSNETNGGAIMVNGAATDQAGQLAVGLCIENNLIEAQGYTRPIYCKSMTESFIAGNNVFDAAGFTTCSVYLDALSEGNVVIRGLAPAGAFPYLIDQATTTNGFVSNGFISGRGEERSRLASLEAGTPASPNLFHATKFDGTFGNALLIQPSAATVNGASIFNAVRSAAEVSNAGGNIYKLTYAGGVEIDGPTAGNVTNANAGSLQVTNQGRTQICDGAFTLSSGPSGSYFDLKGFKHRFYDHNANLGVTVSATAAGGVGAGFDLGSSADVSLYRRGANQLETNAAMKVGTFTVATLPNLGANGKGATAFASNGRKTGEGAAAGTGVPVYYNGTGLDWRTFPADAAVAA